MFSSKNVEPSSSAALSEPRPWTYGAESESDVTQAPAVSELDTVMEQNAKLRLLCGRLVQTVDKLSQEKNAMNESFQTYRILFQQLKIDRNRLGKQLSAMQRELCYIKRERRTFETGNQYCSIKRRRHSPVTCTKSFPSTRLIEPETSTKLEIGEHETNQLKRNSWHNSIEFTKSMLDLSADEEHSGRGEAMGVESILHDQTPTNSWQEEALPVPVEADCVVSISNEAVSYDPNGIGAPRDVILDISACFFCGIIFESALSSGVMIKEVIQGSPGHEAGLLAGDQVLEIAGINMRLANHGQANKILADCQLTRIPMKVVHRGNMQSLALAGRSESFDGHRRSLVRRMAFKDKTRSSIRHVSNRQQAMLYQTCHLNVEMPRRIFLPRSWSAAIRLLGGNSVGIFVHSILDQQLLGSYLQQGDRILEYNNINLRHATAEKACFELASPASSSVLVVHLDLDTYQQCQREALGDSFYIRALVSADLLQNTNLPSNQALQFKKGDLLHVDSTIIDNRSGLWHAWKVDRFGNRTSTVGVIPSMANTALGGETSQFNRASSSRRSLRRIFAIFRFVRYFSRRKPNGYRKLDNPSLSKPRSLSENSRVLAVYENLDNQSDDGRRQSQESLGAQSVSVASTSTTTTIPKRLPYQMVTLVHASKPRPVILFGPYGKTIAAQLEQQYPSLFQICSPVPGLSKDMPGVEVDGGGSSSSSTSNIACSDHYLQCTQSEGTLECVSLNQIVAILDNNLHPVIIASTNCLNQFRRHELFPIVGCIRFRSANHLRSTINQSWRGRNHTIGTVSNKLAKSMFVQSKQLEKDFDEDEIDFIVQGNVLSFMASLIKTKVEETQNHITWNCVEDTSFACK